MKTINLILILPLFYLFACNSSSSQKQAGTNDSSKNKVTEKPFTDTLAEDKASDTDYAKAHLTLSNLQWLNVKSTYHLLDKNIRNRYDKKSYNPELIKGDFNGDKKTDTMLIVPPIFKDTLAALGSQKCIGGCNSYIIFSDTSIHILRVQNNLGGEIANVGDLDGDGADEILVYPDWWQSNWNPYKLFSYNRQTQKWNYLIEPVSIFMNDMEETKVLVKRSKRKGFVNAFTSIDDIDGNVHSSYNDFKIIKK